jgi:uncharacterized alpha-E superfamily protein
LSTASMDKIFQSGLHEFLSEFIQRNNDLSSAIATDFHFL